MKKSRFRKGAEAPSETLPEYKLLSGNLILDSDRWILFVRKLHSREGDSEWQSIDIGAAWLPPTPANSVAIQFRDRPEICWTIVAAIDSYLIRQRSSKSGHVVVADIARFLYKLHEYAWLRDYYRVQDMPIESWVPLRRALVEGGWVKALDVERRLVDLLKTGTVPASQFLSESHYPGGCEHVNSLLNRTLGTNISGRELAWIRTILLQANGKNSFRSGDVGGYRLLPKRGMSQTMLLQCLRAFNTLSDIEGPLGLPYVPVPDSHRFAKQYGRPGGRTTNLSPELGAALLEGAFKWVYDYADAIADLVEALACQLSVNYGVCIEPRVARMTPGSADEYRSKFRNSVLRELPERRAVEALVGRSITTFTRLRPNGKKTSLYALLNQLYSACFVVLAAMNARRRDEVSHSAIGLHDGCVRVVDAELGLAECEFYIEKTLRGYDWLFVNEVTQRAVSILQRISGVTWGWEEHISRTRSPGGRSRKLFCYPRFCSPAKGPMLWFDFNGNPNGMASEFLAVSLGKLNADFVVAPHMFRRLYGLIYHYRFEDATLVALAQKYRHFDVTSVLRYIENGTELQVGAHATVLWSSSSQQARAKLREFDSIWSEVEKVGVEKLLSFVEHVVGGVRRFSGGFERLVSRFHRRMSGHIDYQQLDEAAKSRTLNDALLGRGHVPEPFRHVTCMAGANRKSAACSSNGRLWRELAGPKTCSGCSYSVIVEEHVSWMEEDARSLEAMAASSGESVRKIAAMRELDNLRRVIYLNKRRLGAPT